MGMSCGSWAPPLRLENTDFHLVCRGGGRRREFTQTADKDLMGRTFSLFLLNSWMEAVMCFRLTFILVAAILCHSYEVDFKKIATKTVPLSQA